MTPMVHWPETMMTLCKGEVSHLFTGDAFGCFGALNGGLIDQEIDTDWCWLEMVRYYSNIVGKYGTPVQNALKKLAGIHIDYICSTHGPVWHKYVDKVIGLYDRMSKYETEPGLVICYGTMYGNTERMAEQIARAASLAGVKNIVCTMFLRHTTAIFSKIIFRFRGLIVGAPTYNASSITRWMYSCRRLLIAISRTILLVGLVLTHGLQRLLLPLANGMRIISTSKKWVSQ